MPRSRSIMTMRCPAISSELALKVDSGEIPHQMGTARAPNHLCPVEPSYNEGVIRTPEVSRIGAPGVTPPA